MSSLIYDEEVNQIYNRKLKERLLDTAMATLVNLKEIQPKDFEGVQAEFGYILNIKDHGLEALFKIVKDDKVFYFALQQNALKLLSISEEQFRSVTQHMLDMHVNNK